MLACARAESIPIAASVPVYASFAALSACVCKSIRTPLKPSLGIALSAASWAAVLSIFAWSREAVAWSENFWASMMSCIIAGVSSVGILGIGFVWAFVNWLLASIAWTSLASL